MDYKQTPALRPRAGSIPERAKPADTDPPRRTTSLPGRLEAGNAQTQLNSTKPPAASIAGPEQTKQAVSSDAGTGNARAGSIPKAGNRPAVSGDTGKARPRAASLPGGTRNKIQAKPRAGSVGRKNPTPNPTQAKSKPEENKNDPTPEIPEPLIPTKLTRISRRAKFLAAGKHLEEYENSSLTDSEEYFAAKALEPEKIPENFGIDEMAKRRKYILLGMKPAYSPSIQAIREVEPDYVYDEMEDLEFHLDNSGFQVLKKFQHVFLQIGSKIIGHLVRDEEETTSFAHTYEIMAGGTGQRLLLAAEMFEELTRDCFGCIDRSTQRYELVVVTCEGKGVFTAKRQNNVVTFTDFRKDIAYMVRTDEDSGKHPQFFVIKDAETGKELCRLIPNPFQDKGEYQVLMGPKDEYIGKISTSWTGLGKGEIDPNQQCLGLKFLKDLDPTIKGYLVGALFNTYFTFDQSSENRDTWKRTNAKGSF